MTHEQENLKQGILNYLQMESTGALMVTGPWGCGKSYFFEHVLFAELKDEKYGYKPVRVSLFGMSSLRDLSKNIICEFAQYVTDNKTWKKILRNGAKFIKKLENLKVPVISDYVDLKSILGEGKVLYKLVPPKAVICLDDLERAIERYDINDLLGVVNDLVENQHFKVIVIANKEYIDERQNLDDKTGKAKTIHEVFYEKVIEKTLHFSPDIVGVFNTLLESKENDNGFKEFMLQSEIANSINPSHTKKAFLKRQKENIRTLKFAVSHFKLVFDDYVSHGKDVNDKQIKVQLINQWHFIYSLSLESKQTSLSLDNNMGLEEYVPIAPMSQIDLGDEHDEISFDESNENDEKQQVSIADKFVKHYYKDKENEYIFYPHLYKLVIGGISYDFDKAFASVSKVCERFDYHTNPAQEIMDKWMKGYWTMTDEEAKENLLKLRDFVEDGKLMGFPAYYNASVFLFKFCGIIDTTIEELLPLFEKGIKKYADSIKVDEVSLSVIKAMGFGNNDICKRVFDMIVEAMEKRNKQQQMSDVIEMKKLFIEDIPAFCNLFMPNNQSTPKFFNIPMLHLIDAELIEEKIAKATANDIMSLYCMVTFRFNSKGLPPLQEERSFIERLEKIVSLRAADNKKLSSVVILDSLLPLLRNVMNKF